MSPGDFSLSPTFDLVTVNDGQGVFSFSRSAPQVLGLILLKKLNNF